MPSGLLAWIRNVGAVLLVITMVSFIFQVKFFGIPTLILEGIGLAMFLFVTGYNKKGGLLIIMLVSFVIAVIFDPLVWKVRGLSIQSTYLLSLKINVILIGIVITFYALGCIIRNRYHNIY